MFHIKSLPAAQQVVFYCKHLQEVCFVDSSLTPNETKTQANKQTQTDE